MVTILISFNEVFIFFLIFYNLKNGFSFFLV